MTLREELVRLINDNGIFAVANALQKIATEESDEDISPNRLKARGPLEINNHRILALHLNGALDEMDEIVKR